VALTPVSDGIEKFSHAAGPAAVIEASLVKVTVKGSFARPEAARVSVLARVCELPFTAVE
jgi:hypothetical protein